MTAAVEAPPAKTPFPEKEDNLTYQLWDLAAFDIAPIDAGKDNIDELARDNIQLLVNKVFQLPTERMPEGVIAKLPEVDRRLVDGVRLPREKPLPKHKPKTRWEKFAEQKGIEAHKKRGRMVWDDAVKDWVPRWGPNSVKHSEEKHNWLVEINEDRGDNPFEDPFAKATALKKLTKAKQGVREMRNKLEAVGKKLPAGISGGPDVGSVKRGTVNLRESLARAQKSSASVGKFDKRQRDEKEVAVAKRRKVDSATPLSSEKSANVAMVSRMLSAGYQQPAAVDKKKAANIGQTMQESANKEAKASGKQREAASGRRSKQGRHAKGGKGSKRK